jgi:hypothetical protein
MKTRLDFAYWSHHKTYLSSGLELIWNVETSVYYEELGRDLCQIR